MKKLFFILNFLLIITFGFAQVGINTATPDAQLQIKSSNQATPANNDGILIPKIDAFPLTNPTVAQNSMMVYLTTTSAGKQPGFYFWDNATTSWKELGGSASNWSLTGIDLANNNSGNVGIGTGATIPSSLLTVKKDGIGFTQEDVSGVSKIGFYTVASDAWIQTHSNSDLKFATNNGATQMVLQKATGNLGINTLSPSEKLEVTGKTKTTNLQVTTGAVAGNVLTSDATGNATWQTPSIGNAWSINGNSNINPAVNFIGTTNNYEVFFRHSNEPSGVIGTSDTSFGKNSLGTYSLSNENSAFGVLAMGSIGLTGNQNTAVGNKSMQNINSGSKNAAIGYESLKGSSTPSSNTGSSNTAIGYQTLNSNSTGDFNVANGFSALFKNTTGDNNTANGAASLYSNTSGYENTATGNASLYTNATGFQNVANGFDAMYFNDSGSKNVVAGYRSLYNNTIGSDNIVSGFEAMRANKSASKNIAIGTQALFKQNFTNAGAVYDADNVAIGYQSLYNTNGTTNANGTGNIGIGKYTLSNNATGNNNIALGNSALGVTWTATGTMTGSNNIALGSASIKSLTSGSNNIALGNLSLSYNQVGSDNISLGKDALYYSVSQSNGLAIGTRAMQNYAISGSVGTNDNVAIGYEALKGTTCCTLYNQNTAVGYQAITAITSGSANTGIGYQSLFKNTSGYQNTATGFNSLNSNSTGTQNSGFGVQTLFKNTIGNYNAANGFESLYSNINGDGNSATGYSALYSNTSGGANTAIGSVALYSNTIGSGNTAIGNQSLKGNLTGTTNTACGTGSLLTNTLGDNNTAFGTEALYLNTGSGNVAVGYRAGFNETTSNKLYIENSNSTTPLIYGEFDNNLLRFHGNLEVDNIATANNKMQLVNKNNFVHGIGNQIFGNGGDDFMLSSKEGATETAGIYGDGNAISMWSAGDANQGQAAALVYFLDEDNFDGSNTNPYDASSLAPFAVALKSYITPAGAYFQVSDKNKKENIQKIENATEKINQISGYTYQFKLAASEIKKGDKPIKSSGVLAQEIEKILPEAVQKNANGDYFVDYAAISPLLIEAIKEQNAKIKSLENINAEIIKRLEKLENK